MCGYRCEYGGRYIPGPPSVCQERGLNFCGPSRGWRGPDGERGPYGREDYGERGPDRREGYRERGPDEMNGTEAATEVAALTRTATRERAGAGQHPMRVAVDTAAVGATPTRRNRSNRLLGRVGPRVNFSHALARTRRPGERGQA